MGWYYKSPQVFPAIYYQALHRAVAELNTPVILWDAKSFREAQAKAEDFRYFRWCVRQQPDADRVISNLLTNYHIRSKVVTDEVGHRLEILAQPTKVSEFIRLNPILAPIILLECQ